MLPLFASLRLRLHRLVFVASTALAACGGAGSSADPDGGPGGADARPAPDAFVIPGLGDSCATGCIGAEICANASESCQTGYCLFDGQGELSQSYCTASCAESGCPLGYSCMDVPFELTRACVADPAVCGDGVVQRGETCDDGNTGSDDGCRGDCAALDTPLAQQERLAVDLTLSGMHRPEGSETLEPFTVEVDFDAQLYASGNDCEAEAGTLTGGTSEGVPWLRFWGAACGDEGWAQPVFSVRFAEGDVADAGFFPRVCASFSLPQPGDDPLGARVEYCAAQGADSLVVDEVSPGEAGAGALDASGHFTGELELVPNEAIGGCDGLYAPSDCPDIEGPVTVSADFDIRNAPL